MLAFARGNFSTPEGVDNNGTASFIEFPKGKFIVTNFHVWDHFRTQRLDDPGLQTGDAWAGILKAHRFVRCRTHFGERDP